MILILKHFSEVMLKSGTRFLRKSTVKLAQLNDVQFCNEATVVIATTQVVLSKY